jgi:hypothetical protein
MKGPYHEHLEISSSLALSFFEGNWATVHVHICQFFMLQVRLHMYVYVPNKANQSALDTTGFSILIFWTSGFWPRVRARALHAPVFYAKRGAARSPLPPSARSVAASLLLVHPPKIKITYFQKKNFPSGPNSGRQGVYLSTGLTCTLLSYIAPY